MVCIPSEWSWFSPSQDACHALFGGLCVMVASLVFPQVHSGALVSLQCHVRPGHSGPRGQMPRAPYLHSDGDRAARGGVWRPHAAHWAPLPPPGLCWEPGLPGAGCPPVQEGQRNDLRLGVRGVHALHGDMFGRYWILCLRHTYVCVASGLRSD